MIKKFICAYLFIFVIFCSSFSNAGNHEVIHPVTGESIGWENAVMPYWVDKGPLGNLSNDQAVTILNAMMNTWEDVETSSFIFDYQGDLPEDVTEENFPEYLAMTSCGGSDNSDIPKDVVPIVFDTNGKILDYLAGKGASAEIGGLSTLRCFSGTLDNPLSIYQGMVIINGQFIDGEDSPKDLKVNSIAGVILHELGHLLGLDHTAFNEEIFSEISSGSRDPDDSRYLPVMLPTVLRQSTAATTLHPDDIAAISTLYPAEGYHQDVGMITGSVQNSDGKPLQKVNVIARNEDDPLCEVYAGISGRRCTPIVDSKGNPNFNMTTCASDFALGDYEIEGVVPGSYTVEVEELEAGWIRQGMYPSKIDDDLPGDAEFYNSKDSADDDSPYVYSLLEIGKNGLIERVDIILNDSTADSEQLDHIPIDSFEAGEGLRCKIDPVDFDELFAGNLDPSSAYLSENGDVDDVDDGESISAGKGGCSFHQGSTSSKSLFLIVILLLGGLVLMRFKKRFFIPITLLIFLVSLSGVASASSIVPVDLEKMSKKAGKIFHGKCVDVEVKKDERGLISTYITYEVLRGVRGADSKMVTFKMFGSASGDGQVGRTSMVGVESFHVGKEDVLFLYEESPWGFTSPVGLWQGSIPVVRTEKGPELNRKSQSYQNSIKKFKASTSDGSIDVKSNTQIQKEIQTPDQLLDQVELILNK